MFATRSPHRPNFIGLSCVKLQAIKGLTLHIAKHDLLDGTPILDLKPYLNYADSFTSSHQGWVDQLSPIPDLAIEWSGVAQTQIDYLTEAWNCPLRSAIEHRLAQSPFPYPNHRVKELKEGEYELAYKTWRIIYTVQEGIIPNRVRYITIHHLKSGYDSETLMGNKPSRWDDVPIHQAFNRKFLTQED